MAVQDKGMGQRGGKVFAVGDVVHHPNWGAGLVIEVSESTPEMVVDFPNMKGHRVGMDLAQRNFTKLPSDGIEALLIHDPDTAKRWATAAPLKLVAAALSDLGQPSKPAAVQQKLDRQGLLGSKWENWWKRVQPAAKQSGHFRVRSDGTYELRSSVEQIPEEPAAPTEKKKVVRPDESQVLRLAGQIERGEVNVEGLENTETVRLVSKELVRRAGGSEGARAGLVDVVSDSASAVQIRAVVDQLAAGRRVDELAEVALRLARKLLEVVGRFSGEKTVGEAVAARARVLESATEELAKAHSAIREKDSHELVRDVLDLTLSVRERGLSDWRSEALASLGRIQGHLLRWSVGAAEEIGQFLVADPSSIRARAEIAKDMLTNLPVKERGTARLRVLRAALAGRTEAVRGAFGWLVPAEELGTVLGELVGQLTVVPAPGAIERLAEVLAEVEPASDPGVLHDQLWRSLGAAVGSQAANRQLAIPVLRAWQQWLGSLGELTDVDSEELPATVMDATEMAMRWTLRNERAGFRKEIERQEAEKGQLRAEIKELGEELADARRLIETLKAQYRLPEAWAAFRAKREIAEPQARLYQELVIAGREGTNQDWRDWTLARLESGFQVHGISRYGQVGEKSEYDPRLHEYVMGSEARGRRVELKCPGFVWSDPTGVEVVLARAKVVQI